MKKQAKKTAQQSIQKPEAFVPPVDRTWSWVPFTFRVAVGERECVGEGTLPIVCQELKIVLPIGTDKAERPLTLDVIGVEVVRDVAGWRVSAELHPLTEDRLDDLRRAVASAGWTLSVPTGRSDEAVPVGAQDDEVEEETPLADDEDGEVFDPGADDDDEPKTIGRPAPQTRQPRRK